MSQLNGSNIGENQLSDDDIRYLQNLYYNSESPVGYSNADRIWKYVRLTGDRDLTKKDIERWLSRQETFTLHKPARRKFPRPKVIAFYRNFQWDSDTANMVKFEKNNNGYKYFVVFIDIFTRYLYTVPLKSLQGEEMVEAMKSTFSKARAKPLNMRTDKGSEYKNRYVKKFLKDSEVNHIFTNFETKANYAERVIKTIKLKLFKYLTYKESENWVSELEKFTKGYNKSFHRSLKMSPLEALDADSYKVWQNLYQPIHGIDYNNYKKGKYKYEVGDQVKISYLKGTFDREYSEKWSTEVFRIIERKKNQSIPMYKLKDYDNDIIEGYFYEAELQPAYIDDETVYKVEKIINKRKRKGVKEVLVKWKGWPDKYNSWVKERDLKDIT